MSDQMDTVIDQLRFDLRCSLQLRWKRGRIDAVQHWTILGCYHLLLTRSRRRRHTHTHTHTHTHRHALYIYIYTVYIHIPWDISNVLVVSGKNKDMLRFNLASSLPLASAEPEPFRQHSGNGTGSGNRKAQHSEAGTRVNTLRHIRRLPTWLQNAVPGYKSIAKHLHN